MLAETWEDVVRWSNQGYVGVEMEAATVFAASKHFGVPAAAILRIGDNLIEEQTVMDVNYENTKDLRRQISQDSFDIVVEELLTLA
jgi:uridine phosphorylase